MTTRNFALATVVVAVLSLFVSVTSVAAMEQKQYDLLVMYTAEYEAQLVANAQQFGLNPSVQSRITYVVENSNSRYNHLAGVTIKVRGVVKTDRPEDGDHNAVLNYLRTDPQVQALRDEFGADVVTMIGTPPVNGNPGVAPGPWANSGGSGNNPNAAFSVLVDQGLNDTVVVSMSHEIVGHNSGASHVPDTVCPKVMCANGTAGQSTGWTQESIDIIQAANVEDYRESTVLDPPTQTTGLIIDVNGEIFEIVSFTFVADGVEKSAQMTNPFEGNGTGQVSGLFYFLKITNWELMMKVLDGCGINDHYWVFAGMMTNLEYKLDIWQHSTNERLVISNPPGNIPVSVANTSAFPCN